MALDRPLVDPIPNLTLLYLHKKFANIEKMIQPAQKAHPQVLIHKVMWEFPNLPHTHKYCRR